MPVVACPKCATKLRAGEAFAGKSARCPRCGTVLQLPATAVASRAREDDAADAANGRPGPDAARDRPQKKPKKQRQGRGVPPWAILAAVGVVFVGVLLGGSLLAYVLLGSKDKDKSPATNSQAGSSPAAPRSGEAVEKGGVKYVPRVSEEKLNQFLKDRDPTTVTDEQVFAIMGEPTRRDTPITANKNGQVFTVYKAYWEVPGSGVTSQIGFVNGRMSGAIIGLEVTPSGSANKK